METTSQIILTVNLFAFSASFAFMLNFSIVHLLASTRKMYEVQK